MPLAARFKLSKYTENKGTSIRKSYSKLINLFQIQLNINCWWNIRIFFLNGIFIYSIQNTDYSDRDVNHRLLLLNYLIDCICYRLGSRFRVNEPSQIQNDAEIYNKAYLSMIPKTWLILIIWLQKAVLQPCYSRNFHLEPTTLLAKEHAHQNPTQRFQLQLKYRASYYFNVSATWHMYFLKFCLLHLSYAPAYTISYRPYSKASVIYWVGLLSSIYVLFWFDIWNKWTLFCTVRFT